MKNKTKKYFIKYSLEFFVIVLGITFSFFLQNVRQEKELDSKRQLIISNLLDELESNQNYITKRKSEFVREMDYVKKLLDDSLTFKMFEEYPKESSPLNPFFSVLRFEPSSSTYNSLVNDGSLNLIKSSDVKTLINEVYKSKINYLNYFVDAEYKAAIEVERIFINNYPEIYLRNFWFNYSDKKLINNVFKIMKKDIHFKALMVQKISFMEVKIGALNSYAKQRDSLITLLKNKKLIF